MEIFSFTAPLEREEIGSLWGLVSLELYRSVAKVVGKKEVCKFCFVGVMEKYAERIDSLFCEGETENNAAFS